MVIRWLLESTIKQVIESAQKIGALPTAEQQAVFEANRFSDMSDTPAIVKIAGNTAEIKITGVITNTPSFLAMLFGGGNTTYPDIIKSIAIAEQDSNVDNIIYTIDSPGGEFDGLFNTIAAMKNSQKPSKAVVTNLAASAAYALAAQADTIVASNQASRVGSVGVVATFQVDDSTVEITNTKSPKKRPDVTTDQGKKVVQEELDPIYDVFVGAIAEGRKVTVEKINADFGQGLTILASEALKRGMIDSVVDNTSITNSRNVETNLESTIMDLKTLMAQHPDVYAEAMQKGVDGERDRVNAHLTMGVTCGDMKIALESVKNGSPMTETLRAEYWSLGMNRAQLQDRQEDDLNAGAGDNATDPGNKDKGSEVADLVETKLGIEVQS